MPAFRRRRLDDEEGDLDDDSMTEGSVGSDNGHADSDTSNIEEVSPVGNGRTKSTGMRASKPQPDDVKRPSQDDLATMQGLSLNDQNTQANAQEHTAPAVKAAPNGPLVVSSSSATRQSAEPLNERRRREHDEYKRRRDEDPAFVPNRGAFFMHDHRHSGPAANGFRPFGRGRGRGGRGGPIGGPYAPFNQFAGSNDPLASGQWAHDMHEAVAQPTASRPPRQPTEDEGPPNGNGIIPTRPPNSSPINRTMSTDKHLGNVQVKVFLPTLGLRLIASSMPVKQYTKLPDHRPPLRRDKPVRISLPERPPRYVFPAMDRSFIFIPRAMRPNQQRARGKPRSGLGSVGGYSRRTSVFGGSYYGSAYSPSVAMSRRSSIAQDSRDYIISPTGSVMSRPPMPSENQRPIVRLPPAAQPPFQGLLVDQSMPFLDPFTQQTQASIVDFPPPQIHPLPQKPVFKEALHQPIPMHQPRPQKAVSVADIDSPSLLQQPFQEAFHQQVPVQVHNGLGHDNHSRQPSYPTHHSTGTPLAQIPERAIHAAPFQPTPYQQQQSGYYGQTYGIMQPQQGYYYNSYNGGPIGPSAAAAAPFVPVSHHTPGSFPQQTPNEHQALQQPQTQHHGQQALPPSNMVAQEVNGMVYYYDASQMNPMNTYAGYQGSQGYAPGHSLVTPSPDGFYYPQQAPRMVYYPQ